MLYVVRDHKGVSHHIAWRKLFGVPKYSILCYAKI